jgi:hypothetical protein
MQLTASQLRTLVSKEAQRTPSRVYYSSDITAYPGMDEDAKNRLKLALFGLCAAGGHQLEDQKGTNFEFTDTTRQGVPKGDWHVSILRTDVPAMSPCDVPKDFQDMDEETLRAKLSKLVNATPHTLYINDDFANKDLYKTQKGLSDVSLMLALSFENIGVGESAEVPILCVPIGSEKSQGYHIVVKRTA